MSCAERSPRRRRFPLQIRAARTPDAPALIWAANAADPSVSPVAKGGSRAIAAAGNIEIITFADLDRWTLTVARSLLGRGIAPGERVALRLPAGPSSPALLLSVLRAGCVAVPVSSRLPRESLPGLLARVACRRLIDGFVAPAALAGGIEVIEAGRLESEALGSERILPAFDRGADATIVFTSGSTGIPKAALHSFDNHWASAAGANRNIPLRPGDRWLLSLPLWHVGGLAVLFRCLQAGAAVVLASKSQPPAEAIECLGVTHLSLVSTQLYRLLREPRGRQALRLPKAVLLGGGPVPFPLLEEAARLGARLIASYGSTEMASQATATRPGEPVELLATAGRPLAFREVAVDAGGEILVRGRTLFRGYVEGASIRPARDEAGWFHTGDLGRLDAEGRLLVEGRRDAMFISGGENIHPEEIERELLRHPDVLEALVVPVADAEFGARPVAFLRTADGGLPDAGALGDLLRKTLPGFKVPARYLRWPELEEGMKPDRRAFAARASG